jgi:hypothetical protein
VRLDAREFFVHDARRVSATGALLPHLEARPQLEGEEAHEDVGLNAILRADVGPAFWLSH